MTTAATGKGRRTHLSRTRLRQIGNDVDTLGCSERSDNLANLEDEFLGEGGFVPGLVLEFGLQGDEGIDGLAGEFISGTDN